MERNIIFTIATDVSQTILPYNDMLQSIFILLFNNAIRMTISASLRLPKQPTSPTKRCYGALLAHFHEQRFLYLLTNEQ
jgi:hypothetical protein